MSPFVESAAAAAYSPLRPSLLAVIVDLDRSVLLQMALFAILVVVLKPLLFDPMLRVFALREERTVGVKDDARSMQERAAEILSQYEKELALARATASEEREKQRRETAQLEAQILEEARQAADAIAEAGRQQIAVELARLEKELAARSTSLSQELSSKVLGREVRS